MNKKNKITKSYEYYKKKILKTSNKFAFMSVNFIKIGQQMTLVYKTN